MTQQDRARRFTGLHSKGNPLVLYNAWDAGSAKTIAAAGAKAIATSSWAVAAAQGFADGEDLPIDVAEQIVARIVKAVDLPVTMDFEGGYSEDDGELAANITRILELGIVGINFEDRIVKGSGLYEVDRHAKRIQAIRKAAESKGIDLFINARTDVFFQNSDHAQVVGHVIDRAKAYAAAGASGLFVPGLTDNALIERVSAEAPMPVNVMIMDGMSSVDRLSNLGVARISYGATPYAQAMKSLGEAAKASQ